MTRTSFEFTFTSSRLDCFLLPFFQPPSNSPLPRVRPSSSPLFFKFVNFIFSNYIYFPDSDAEYLFIKHYYKHTNVNSTTTSIFILEAPPLLPTFFVDYIYYPDVQYLLTNF